MIYKEWTGQLLVAPKEYVLAFPITQSGFRKGSIAQSVLERYPEMRTKLSQTKLFNGCVVGHTDSETKKSSIAVVVGKDTKTPATYNDLDLGFRALKAVLQKHNMKNLAVPPFCCGENSDGLDWERVSYILCGVFYDTDVKIVVCHGIKEIAVPA